MPATGQPLTAGQARAAADAPATYCDGIDAILKIASQFTDADWNAPTPCPEWRAADIAGHLRCVADDYHEYLDAAPVSRLARLMATGAHPETIARKQARQNAAELAALPEVPPEEHIAAFAQSALRYAARLSPLLRLPHHSYRGRVITVAGMAGLACVEWHVHAWDLASALGTVYRPADPEAVLAAWMAGIPQLPIASDDDPWLAVLRSAGRLPALSQVAARAWPRPRWSGRPAGHGEPSRPRRIADMPVPALTARARAAWEELAGPPARFTPTLTVAVSPRSLLCPPGWVGLVVLGDAVLATAPGVPAAQVVHDALGAVPMSALSGARTLAVRLNPARVLGPAILAYLEAGEFRPLHDGQASLGLTAPRGGALRSFLAAAAPEDVDESGLTEITSPGFAIRERGRVVAAAGYRDWPGGVAHLSVLTAADARGRGLARVAASAAVAHALGAGRLPQWRARPQQSRRVARALGFRELGAQVSVRLRDDRARWPASDEG